MAPSQILSSDLERPSEGSQVWVPDLSGREPWVKAVAQNVTDTSVTAVNDEDKKIHTHKIEAVSLVNPASLLTTGVEDMEVLSYLHEPALLNNVHLRFTRDLIYTYTGDILIAANPYKALDIYGDDTITKYRRGGSELPPHIFAVAENAYRLMLRDGVNQSLIISGESGAGKTETTKMVMKYLAAVAGGGGESDVGHVSEMILEANPLLEAFGNAKTIRNDNSSRFGKFIEIQFDQRARIVGANILTYLLEKSRLIHQAPDERNYHIFYQFCKGASDAEKAEFDLRDASFYRYLSGTNAVIDGIDDGAEYNLTKESMRIVGLKEDEINSIFRILAGVLWLGNVDFEAKMDDSAKVLVDAALKNAAKLLQVDQDALSTALVTRVITVQGNTTNVLLTVPQAVHARDALAKAVYNRLFNHLVRRINTSICHSKAVSSIGVLDIFGFEIFKLNEFEQFCINYCNEKLQQQFNDYTFRQELKEYEREGIDFDSSGVTIVDNSGCIDLIEARMGIIKLLDEECAMPNGSDKQFVEKLHRQHPKHDYMTKPRLAPNGFTVKHYAGDVTYEAHEFLDKNADTIRPEMVRVVKDSSCELVQHLFSGDEMPQPGVRKSQSITVSVQFKNQLNELMAMLGATEPHYVRCLKSNSLKKPRVFEKSNVLNQLRCAGVLQTIKIRRSGYPSRALHADFFSRYRILAPNVSETDMKVACRKLLDNVGMDAELAQLGKTKVFLRVGILASLEKLKAERLYMDAVRIQRNFRRWHVQRWYKTLKKSTVKIQSVIRGARARMQFAEFVAEIRARAAELKRQEAERLAREEADRLARERAQEQLEMRLMAAEEEESRRLAAAEREAERVRLVAEEWRRKGRERAMEAKERAWMMEEELEQRWVEKERIRFQLVREHKIKARTLATEAVVRRTHIRQQRLHRRAIEQRMMELADEQSRAEEESRHSQTLQRRTRHMVARAMQGIPGVARAYRHDLDAIDVYAEPGQHDYQNQSAVSARDGGALPGVPATSTPRPHQTSRHERVSHRSGGGGSPLHREGSDPLSTTIVRTSPKHLDRSRLGDIMVAYDRDPRYYQRYQKILDHGTVLRARAERRQLEQSLAELHQRNRDWLEGERSRAHDRVQQSRSRSRLTRVPAKTRANASAIGGGNTPRSGTPRGHRRSPSGAGSHLDETMTSYAPSTVLGSITRDESELRVGDLAGKDYDQIYRDAAIVLPKVLRRRMDSNRRHASLGKADRGSENVSKATSISQLDLSRVEFPEDPTAEQYSYAEQYSREFAVGDYSRNYTQAVEAEADQSWMDMSAPDFMASLPFANLSLTEADIRVRDQDVTLYPDGGIEAVAEAQAASASARNRSQRRAFEEVGPPSTNYALPGSPARKIGALSREVDFSNEYLNVPAEHLWKYVGDAPASPAPLAGLPRPGGDDGYQGTSRSRGRRGYDDDELYENQRQIRQLQQETDVWVSARLNQSLEARASQADTLGMASISGGLNQRQVHAPEGRSREIESQRERLEALKEEKLFWTQQLAHDKNTRGRRSGGRSGGRSGR